MRDAILTSHLDKVIREEINRKQKEFNCIITLYMADNDPICEMDVLYLDPLRVGGRRQISDVDCAAATASGIINYFKEV